MRSIPTIIIRAELVPLREWGGWPIPGPVGCVGEGCGAGRGRGRRGGHDVPDERVRGERLDRGDSCDRRFDCPAGVGDGLGLAQALALGQGHLCQPGAHPLPDVAYGEGDGVLVGAEVGETASGGEQHARQHRRVAVGLDAPRSTNHTSPACPPPHGPARRQENLRNTRELVGFQNPGRGLSSAGFRLRVRTGASAREGARTVGVAGVTVGVAGVRTGAALRRPAVRDAGAPLPGAPPRAAQAGRARTGRWPAPPRPGAAAPHGRRRRRSARG